MNTSMRVTGLRDIQRAFRQVPLAAARRVVGAGMRGAAGEVRKAARRRVPRDTGALRRAIRSATMRRKRRRNSGGLNLPIAQVITGPRKGQRIPYWGLWVERGHAIVRRGKRIGEVKGTGFLLGAFRSTLSAQGAKAIERATNAMTRELRKIGARYGRVR